MCVCIQHPIIPYNVHVGPSITHHPTHTILSSHNGSSHMHHPTISYFFFTELQDFMFRWCVDILSLSLSLSLFLSISPSLCLYPSVSTSLFLHLYLHLSDTPTHTPTLSHGTFLFLMPYTIASSHYPIACSHPQVDFEEFIKWWEHTDLASGIF